MHLSGGAAQMKRLCDLVTEAARIMLIASILSITLISFRRYFYSPDFEHLKYWYPYVLCCKQYAVKILCRSIIIILWKVVSVVIVIVIGNIIIIIDIIILIIPHIDILSLSANCFSQFVNITLYHHHCDDNPLWAARMF